MRILSRLIDPWLIIGAILFGLGLTAATFLLLIITRSVHVPPGIPTAVLTVIALPSETPAPLSPTQADQPTATPPQLPPAAEDIAIGSYVQISGTGGDGLRLRAAPGLNSEVRMLGLEDEVFVVQDGPQIVDDYTWWYLEGLFDASRRGWAVANYLTVIQRP